MNFHKITSSQRWAAGAVGLAIVLAFFRVRKSIHSDEANLLKN